MLVHFPADLDRRATIKPKQSLSVVVSCFFLMIGLSWQVGAYDEDHLKNLLETNECLQGDLLKADLALARLTGANLTGATFCGTIMPDGTMNNLGC